MTEIGGCLLSRVRKIEKKHTYPGKQRATEDLLRPER
jgi:hypothetical protein